ncbi:hypothetical protein P8452_76628 [Trifolium repens]|nr:hypothetical protein P8452_76628 [Trifolium repens]
MKSIKHHNSKTNQQEHSGEEKQIGFRGSKNHSGEARERKRHRRPANQTESAADKQQAQARERKEANRRSGEEQNHGGRRWKIGAGVEQ